MNIIADGIEVAHEAGKFTRATVEYSGLVSYSIVKKGYTTSKRVFEAGKYTRAAVEYSGLVSYSVVKKSCTASKSMFLRVAKPTAWAVSRPFVVVKGRTAKIFRKIAPKKEALRDLEERLTKIEELGALGDLEGKLMKIEDRLAYMEQHGVTRISQTAAPKKDKKISEDKRFVLQEILQATKALRETE
jgi:hypothetical protein